jgi:hypothetical protein
MMSDVSVATVFEVADAALLLVVFAMFDCSISNGKKILF